MMAPILDVTDLSVAYFTGGIAVPACRNVSLQIDAGKVLGIVGESGSGKSTLITALTRLQRPPAQTTSGQAILQTKRGPIDLISLPEKALRLHRWTSFSVVFQSAMDALNPITRIEAQFVDVLRTHDRRMSKRAAVSRAGDLLEMVGVSRDRSRAYAHELSGGMRQRAAIALSLACNPQLVVMDEPTTAVDAVMQRQIVGTLLQLQQHMGFAVIFVTHDLSLLLEFADEIAVMYAGRIVERGPADLLYKTPQHPYTQGLRDSFPPLRGKQEVITGIPGSPPDPRIESHACPFAARCPRKFDRCETSIPPLALFDGRDVACWLNGTTSGHKVAHV